MSSPAILVTGGAGYIDAHTCKALRGSGYLPVTLDNLSTGHEHFVRWGPLVEADIRDTEAVARTIPILIASRPCSTSPLPPL
jgi:UDP-arabinose 4-epimerase